jgi:hypothetical protein
MPADAPACSLSTGAHQPKDASHTLSLNVLPGTPYSMCAPHKRYSYYAVKGRNQGMHDVTQEAPVPLHTWVRSLARLPSTDTLTKAGWTLHAFATLL